MRVFKCVTHTSKLLQLFTLNFSFSYSTCNKFHCVIFYGFCVEFSFLWFCFLKASTIAIIFIITWACLFSLACRINKKKIITKNNNNNNNNINNHHFILYCQRFYIYKRIIHIYFPTLLLAYPYFELLFMLFHKQKQKLKSCL